MSNALDQLLELERNFAAERQRLKDAAVGEYESRKSEILKALAEHKAFGVKMGFEKPLSEGSVVEEVKKAERKRSPIYSDDELKNKVRELLASGEKNSKMIMEALNLNTMRWAKFRKDFPDFTRTRKEGVSTFFTLA